MTIFRITTVCKRAFATSKAKMSIKQPKIAVGQLMSTDDIESNFQKCRELVKLAKDAKADFLSLPECFEFMGLPGSGDALSTAQPLHGELFSRYRELAKEFGIWLSLGGFHESSHDPKKIFNTHAIVSSSGEIVASYHKLHLFDVDVDGGFKESKSTIPGEQALIVSNTPVGCIGVATCYDLRFAELFTALRTAGAEVLLVPSAFMPTTGRAHWEVLLRARAIETQCYVAAAAQFGQHNPKRGSYGHSMIVDPWGEVLQNLGSDGPGVGCADIDFNKQASIRASMPIAQHRRTDIVEVTVKPGKLCCVSATGSASPKSSL